MAWQGSTTTPTDDRITGLRLELSDIRKRLKESRAMSERLKNALVAAGVHPDLVEAIANG